MDMFARHDINNNILKRVREDPEEALCREFGNRIKRHQALPLRTFSAHSWFNREDGTPFLAHNDVHANSQRIVEPTPCAPIPDVDADMMMTDDGPEPEACPADTGRLPTPILPTFAAQDRSVPRSLEHPSAALAEWNMVQNRPLPSPISESGGEDMSSPDMVLDCHAPPQRSMSAMEMVSHPHGAPPSSPPQEHPNLQQYQQATREGSPSPRKGHTRSRHTVNSWTTHGGMKKSFSIGYRADCEKCRLKVPGHFNHIVVS